MSNQKVVICGVNTAKLPVLKNDEIRALLVRVKDGDRTAREALISGNLRLVLSVVRRFTNRGEAPDDLFQVGTIGLMKAIDNFDITLDVRFSTYAVPMIIGELRRYLRDNSTIRVSRSLRDTAYRALQLREKMTGENNREPNVEEIAKKMDMKKEDVVYALDAISEPISLYDPVYADGNDTVCVMDQVSDTDNTDEHWLENVALSQALEKLNEREKRILAMRFYGGKTQNEVSREIGISQAQVSRLEKSALERIRKNI